MSFIPFPNSNHLMVWLPGNIFIGHVWSDARGWHNGTSPITYRTREEAGRQLALKQGRTA